jgi:ElaB/YqjD/DUF883 family membrane-anchored ribosome-binding protein
MHKDDHDSSHDGHTGLLDQARVRISDLTKEAIIAEEKILDRAKKQGVALMESAQESGEEAWKKTARVIRDNPAASVGVAFAVGVIVRSWLGRKKH